MRKPFLPAFVAVLTVSSASHAETLTPVDVPGLRAQIIASKPTAPVELRIRNKGRVQFSQGESVVVFTKSGRTGPRITTQITDMSGNRFCIAETRNWSGMCVEMFRAADNGYLCRGEYGNGYGFDTRDCWITIPR